VGTGNSAAGFKKDFYTYDPSSNSWEQITDFAGTARRAAVAFSMENYGFIGTGDDGTLCNDFWMYNPQTEQWIQKANFPGGTRSGACGWAAFPVCYLGTGQDANYTYLNDLWEYNYFLNNWTQRADLPGPGRKNAVAFYLDGLGFIGTGYNNGTFYDDLWAYSGTAALAEQEGSAIEVFPNPTADFIALTTALSEENITIFNQFGQKMIFTHQKVGSKMLLDVRHFPEGLYYLQLNGVQLQQSTTFVKCNGSL
jgi:N-acetylneuraminic acid mutarotase